nr:amino acid adenylation domain-containing protein [Acidobacteriota bacterium]
MSAISDFVTRLTALGVKLWVEEAELKLRAPKGTLTSDLVTQLKARKAEILSFLSEQQQVRERQPIAPSERLGRDWDGRLPLSFAQQRMWFFDQLDHTGSGANIPIALRTRGVLDTAAFEASVDAIVQRHESLRTRFCDEDGHPVQRLVTDPAFSIRVVDLTGLEDIDRETVRDALIQAEANAGFELDRRPLFRMVHLRLNDTEGAMVLNMHHIVSDGWSLGVFVQELCAGYAARLQNRDAALSPLPIQYADFAAWQRGYLSDEIRENELNWWREQIGELPILELPTDRPRPALQTTNGDLVRFRIDTALTQALEDMAREHDATLFMVLQAALSALLSRLCGQDRFGIGAAIANRNRRELEPLIGYFVNTLVMSVDTRDDPGFAELVRRARDTAMAAFDHQDIPFEQVVDALQPERDLSRTPFFQVMLILQNAGGDGGQLPGLSMETFDLDVTHPLFDLNFAFGRDEEGLGGALEYNTDLFDCGTVERWLDGFRILLQAATTDPQQPLSTLPLFDAQTNRQLLAWSANSGPVPVYATMHAYFEAQVAANGAAPALAFGDEVLTYEALNRRANQLAHGLRARGIGRGSLVAQGMERGMRPVICQLAVLKSGAAFLPLNPDDPTERLRGILQDAGADLVLCDGTLPGSLVGLPVVNLEETDLAREQSEGNPVGRTGGDDAAYVIYTSGSTGKPKGVVIPHGALVNFADAAADAYNLNTGERALQFANLHFDTFIEEIYTTIGRCGLLIPRTRDMIRSTRHFLDECGRLDITILNLPTAYWHQITADLAAGEAEMPSCIRVVIVGGERMLPEMVTAWQKALGAYPELKNGYGPTETTVAVTAWTPALTQPPRFESGHTPIGGPYRNVRAYVCDRFGNPSPVGVPGELWIGGLSVARGYLGRPALTAQQFVPDPFAETPGSRVYRTGDLARRLPDGNLECIGRADHQVKVRGYRIELGEVESALSELADVALAAVDVRGRGADAQLIAWLQAAEGGRLDAAVVRRQLSQNLPEYMIPTFIHCAAEPLPLTSTGKVDRRALAALFPDEMRPETTGRSPQTPTEQLLADIFSEVLGLETGIDAETSFFDMGGHSLLATRVVARVEKRLGCALPLQDLFTHPTVAALAHRVESGLGIQVADRKPIPVFDREREPVPLSFAQRRLWFLDRFEGASATYNMPTALRLEGAVDSRRLDLALRGIIQRHEVLRAAFPAVDGEAEQVFLPMDRFGLTVVDLSGLAESERLDAARRLRNLDVVTPFNLKT